VGTGALAGVAITAIREATKRTLDYMDDALIQEDTLSVFADESAKQPDGEYAEISAFILN